MIVNTVAGDLGALDRLLLGTGSGIPMIVPGFAIHELRLLVRAGLTPGEAIPTGTHNAAAFLGGPMRQHLVPLPPHLDRITTVTDVA